MYLRETISASTQRSRGPGRHPPVVGTSGSSPGRIVAENPTPAASAVRAVAPGLSRNLRDPPRRGTHLEKVASGCFYRTRLRSRPPQNGAMTPFVGCAVSCGSLEITRHPPFSALLTRPGRGGGGRDSRRLTREQLELGLRWRGHHRPRPGPHHPP